MTSTINASTSSGIVSTADTSGALALQSAGTSFLTSAAGYTVALQGATAVTGCGISFPATQNASSNANTLDDYEEGTFTPSITATGVTAYATRIGKYTKIGQVVVINIDFVTAISTGTTGTFTISNAPFTQAGFQATASARESGLGTGFLNSVWMVGNTTTILVEGAQLVAGYGYAFTIVYQV